MDMDAVAFLIGLFFLGLGLVWLRAQGDRLLHQLARGLFGSPPHRPSRRRSRRRGPRRPKNPPFRWPQL